MSRSTSTVLQRMISLDEEPDESVIGIMTAVATPTEPVIQVDDDLSLPESVVEDLVARKERARQEQSSRPWREVVQQIQEMEVSRRLGID